MTEFQRSEIETTLGGMKERIYVCMEEKNSQGLLKCRSPLFFIDFGYAHTSYDFTFTVNVRNPNVRTFPLLFDCQTVPILDTPNNRTKLCSVVQTKRLKSKQNQFQTSLEQVWNLFCSFITCLGWTERFQTEQNFVRFVKPNVRFSDVDCTLDFRHWISDIYCIQSYVHHVNLNCMKDATNELRLTSKVSQFTLHTKLHLSKCAELALQ